MSLDPHFASSAYGLIAIAEMGLLALSVSVFAAAVGPPPGRWHTAHAWANFCSGFSFCGHIWTSCRC